MITDEQLPFIIKMYRLIHQVEEKKWNRAGKSTIPFLGSIACRMM